MADGSYKLVIHTDPEKTLDKDHPLAMDENHPAQEGDPDPDSLREFNWGQTPEGMKEKDWIDMQRREAKLLVEAEMAQVQEAPDEGTKVKGEGEDL